MEQYRSFGGLDTCNHVEFGNFEKSSIIIFENEDKAITNKYDVNTHLDVSCNKKIISNGIVNSMHNKYQKYKHKTFIDKYSKGAIYIPLKAAIDFQENGRDRTVSLRCLYHNNEDGIIINFNGNIPLYIY